MIEQGNICNNWPLIYLHFENHFRHTATSSSALGRPTQDQITKQLLSMDLQHDLEVEDQESTTSTVPGSTAAQAEKLLILCATAIENRNAPLALQAVRALQKISSVDGEPQERVTAYFLNALVTRAGSLLHDHHSLSLPEVQWADRKLGFNELSHLVDMTPFYRFGYMAANGAILDAVEGAARVHIVDVSTSHCMQWPTLLDALADRMDAAAPTAVRLTVAAPTLPTPPQLHPSYHEVGHRLAWWAHKKGVPFEFQILHKPLHLLLPQDFHLRDGEALAVNCSLRLHYLPNHIALATSPSPRDSFLHLLRCLNPNVVTLFEEDCDATATDLVERMTNSYEHEWMLFDYLAAYSSSSWLYEGRVGFEQEVGRRIENIVACEGEQRIERMESKAQWWRRMQRTGFCAIPIAEEVVAAEREMVDDYAVGWGMKVDDDDALTLSWKGHSLAFASAWVPVASPSWL